jgi:transposase
MKGFPLTYEVMPGNTSDKTTLGDFLKKIEKQLGIHDLAGFTPK